MNDNIIIIGQKSRSDLELIIAKQDEYIQFLEAEVRVYNGNNEIAGRTLREEIAKLKE